MGHAKKGFGDITHHDADSGSSGSRQRTKRINIRKQEAPIPNQGKSLMIPTPLVEDKVAVELEDKDFAQRLAAVRMEGEQRRAALPSKAAAASSATLLPFEGSPLDSPIDYSSPPSLSDTIMNQLNADVSDPKLKNAQIGPSQIGVAVGAVALALMFVVVSGGHFAVSKRYKGVRPSGAPPDSMESALLKGRISQLNEVREADPNDDAALEELAVSYAQLYDFKKSAGLLDELVKRKPDDADAWRLLGETTLLSQEPSRSAKAYERASQLTKDKDVQVLTGLVDAYIANAEPAKAVEYVKRVMSEREATTSASSEKSGSEKESTATPEPSTVDYVALDLLLAKTYNGWNGHDNDAITVYDALIKKAPTDFR